MIEKVNPSHPDKVADRIAGAMVDLAYKKKKNPKIAVEVLIGHGKCHIIAETSVHFDYGEVCNIVRKIMNTGRCFVDYKEVPQDAHLAENQVAGIKCGDNGIFKGVPVSDEEATLSQIVRELYIKYPTDGKYIYDDKSSVFIACQSNAIDNRIAESIQKSMKAREIAGCTIFVNPLGYWTGGTDVDTGATNRKLGSDMGRAVTGGGLHGKDLSKADVSVNIACHILAQKYQAPVETFCAIGDGKIVFRTEKDTYSLYYDEVVDMARSFIENLGGFEKLAEWGLF